MKEITKGTLTLKIFDTREEMGRDDASKAAACINQLLSVKETVNVLFASAPSQNELLDFLCEEDVDWSRVNAFHMDEYIGLPEDAPQGFGNYLKTKIFGRKVFRNAYYINNGSQDPEEICRRYAGLLEENPLDFGFFGIGENGHIAFNDPPVALIDDPETVKMVELDPICRQQQVNDGCFASLDLVPTHAITLTVPALLRIPKIFCTAPTVNKAKAIFEMVNGPVSADCPASFMRLHKDVTVYLDNASASLL